MMVKTQVAPTVLQADEFQPAIDRSSLTGLKRVTYWVCYRLHRRVRHLRAR
jgi:hypothetical protein